MQTLDLRMLLIGRVNQCRLRDGRSSPVVIDTWFEDPLTARTYIISRALEGGSIPIGTLIFFRLEMVETYAHFVSITEETEYLRAQMAWVGVLQRLQREQQEISAAIGY